MFHQVLLPLLVTFILTFIYGIERQRSNKPVGFGTFIFVTLGSCALGMVAISGIFDGSSGIIAAIVTGIGFLGAGALIKSTERAYGFTTASSIWLFAIFGLMIGIKQYSISSILYVLVWVVVFSDKMLERRGLGDYRKKVTIVTNKIMDDKPVIDYFAKYSKRFRMIQAQVDKAKNENSLTYLVEGSGSRLKEMMYEIQKEKWVKISKIE